MKTNGLYHLEPLEEIIETILFTSCIREENPVSVIIVGPSGIGKSAALSRYDSKAILHTDSISSKGLYDIANSDKEKLLRFLIIPDMNPTLSRRPTTVQSALASLLSFTSDGTVRIDDGRETKECLHDPVGIVTAATDDIYGQQARQWFILGLRRRIIPIFFKYTRETMSKLQALVREEKIHSTFPPKRVIGLERKAKPNIPKEMAFQIEGLSLQFAALLGKHKPRTNGNSKLTYDQSSPKLWYIRDVAPISPQITLSTMVRAHAYKNKRGTANKEDYEFLCRFLDFCDPERPREI